MIKTEQLIRFYVEGWKEGDKEKILATLNSDCIVRESHGPTYTGLDQVEKWVDQWNKAGSIVNEWTITSMSSWKDGAVFEWNFRCTVEGKAHGLLGISVVRTAAGKITHLREYRMTKPPFSIFHS